MRICSLAIKVLHILVACLIVGSSLGWFPASVNASSRTQGPDFSIYSSLTQNTAIESSPIASNPLYSPASGTWEVTDTIHLSGTERPLQIAVAGGKAYISRNPGHLTVLDLSTNAVVTTISFDPYPGAAPHYIGILGDKAYVALGNLGSDGQLAVINIGNNTVAGYIPVGADPYGVATLDQKVYVTNNVWWSSGDPATVKVVNASTNSVVATIPVGINPTGIAVDPVSKKAYVTNRNDLSKSVSVINTNNNSVIATIPINNPPAGVAISGNRAYVTTVVNMPNGTVEVINIGSDTLISSIPVGRDSWGIAASNDYVFVANQSSSTVSVIEAATNSVVATVNVGDDPTHIAVDPSTNKVYVSNQGDNTISVIQFKETAPPSNQPPAVSITSPPNGATVSGAVSVQGTASDPDGNSQLQRVEVKVDTGGWTQASGTTSWSYSWDTTTIPDGQHSIYARSYDGQAYSSEELIVVSVNNVTSTPSLVDVGISSEAEAWPPKAFLQAKPGDRINTWYRISYAGSLIRVKLRTIIFDPNGSEIDNPLDDPILQISGPTEDTGWVGVTFEIPDEAIIGTYDVRFSVWSEDGAQEYDAVVKSGWLRLGLEEKPDIGSVASINFGNITAGSNSDKTTTVHNDGNTTLTINNITRTAGNPDFTYISPSTPFNVGAGDSKAITIRFAPSSEGLKSATFNINSSDPDETNVIFDVSGIGVTQKGTISVTSDPSGASFTLNGPANYSDIAPWSKTDAPAGTYTITWTPVSGYQTPSQESKTLTQGETVSFQGDYQIAKGTIEVNSNPSRASFTLSGPKDYSGITPWLTTDALAGSYTITWESITGYTTPSSEAKTLTHGSTIFFSVQYQTTLIPGMDVSQKSPDFFDDVLNILGILPSGFAVETFKTWTHYENTNAYWNPLATTRDMGVKSWNFNNAGVKNYADKETGVRATAETLRLSYYEAIRKMLAQESFNEQALQRAVGTWSGRSADTSYVVNLVSEWGEIYPFAVKTAISVTSDPSGASFTLSGPANYSGITPWSTTDASVGTYTITWSFMSGYETPPQEGKPLTKGGIASFHVVYKTSEAFPGANAVTMWDYYSAWGKELPPLSERAKMYEVLGLGSAENYAGTAEQNTRLLNALKERQICPLTAEEVSWVTPQATLVDLIQQEATGGIPVTVDGKLYIILSLKNRIDPVTLKVVPNSGVTKVYVYGDRNDPVSDRDLAQKIGVIDQSLKWAEGVGSVNNISQDIERMQSRWAIHQKIKWLGFSLELLPATAAISVRAYFTGGLSIPKAILSTASKMFLAHASNPGWVLENITLGNFSEAEEEYRKAIELVGSIENSKDYETASAYFKHLFNAYANDYSALQLLNQIDGIGKTTLDELTDLGASFSAGLVGLNYGLFENLVDSLKTSPLTYNYFSLWNQWRSNYEKMVSEPNYHARYTLALAWKDPSLIEEAGSEKLWTITKVGSPVELRVYDSQGRVTGMVNRDERNEIPNSSYYDNAVTILFPSESYSYEVAGMSEGSYDLAVTTVAEQTSTFTLSDVPTSASVVHQYTIDWDALSEGEKGVTMKIDADGDGTFEDVRKFGSEGAGFSWVWITVAVISGLIGVFVGAFMVWRRIGKQQAA